jgi:hypothetical protein
MQCQVYTTACYTSKCKTRAAAGVQWEDMGMINTPGVPNGYDRIEVTFGCTAHRKNSERTKMSSKKTLPQHMDVQQVEIIPQLIH